MAQPKGGFTAIEVVVTLAIVGLLAITAAPLFSDVMDALGVGRARGAAEQVASAIQQTRANAVLRACTYRITFPGNTQLLIEPDTTANNCVAGSPSEGPTALIHNGTVTSPGTPINFTSTGTSSGGTVVVAPSQPEQRTVTVTLAGRVQVTAP